MMAEHLSTAHTHTIQCLCNFIIIIISVARRLADGIHKHTCSLASSTLFVGHQISGSVQQQRVPWSVRGKVKGIYTASLSFTYTLKIWITAGRVQYRKFTRYGIVVFNVPLDTS